MTPRAGLLTLNALPGKKYKKTDWYRAVDPKYVQRPLAWSHTVGRPTRFKPRRTTYPVVYFAPDGDTALLEARARLGHPRSGPLVATSESRQVVQITIRLDRIADLRTASERVKIQTTVQELTGDWEDYAARTLTSPEVSSQPPAPTQALGEALYQRTDCQGFLTPSARNPILPNLVIFPDRVTIDHRSLTIEP